MLQVAVPGLCEERVATARGLQGEQSHPCPCIAGTGAASGGVRVTG